MRERPHPSLVGLLLLCPLSLSPLLLQSRSPVPLPQPRPSSAPLPPLRSLLLRPDQPLLPLPLPLQFPKPPQFPPPQEPTSTLAWPSYSNTKAATTTIPVTLAAGPRAEYSKPSGMRGGKRILVSHRMSGRR